MVAKQIRLPANKEKRLADSVRAQVAKLIHIFLSCSKLALNLRLHKSWRWVLSVSQLGARCSLRLCLRVCRFPHLCLGWLMLTKNVLMLGLRHEPQLVFGFHKYTRLANQNCALCLTKTETNLTHDHLKTHSTQRLHVNRRLNASWKIPHFNCISHWMILLKSTWQRPWWTRLHLTTLCPVFRCSKKELTGKSCSLCR